MFEMFSSANRDEKVFTNAKEYVYERDCSKFIHFGAGSHLCAGASITSTMTTLVALLQFLKALPKLSLIDKEKYKFDGWAFRDVTALMREWKGLA